MISAASHATHGRCLATTPQIVVLEHRMNSTSCGENTRPKIQKIILSTSLETASSVFLPRNVTRSHGVHVVLWPRPACHTFDRRFEHATPIANDQYGQIRKNSRCMHGSLAGYRRHLLNCLDGETDTFQRSEAIGTLDPSRNPNTNSNDKPDSSQKTWLLYDFNSIGATC
jgi:hypothetical protein